MLAKLADAALVVTVGAMLSTENVVLGDEAAAVLPAWSLAVSAAMEMPNVPLPVMLEMVTARVLPVPATLTVPLAVPVVFSVTLAAVNVLELKFGSEYVTV